MNSTITFRGRLAEAMERFVTSKRTQGYDYTDQARMLSYFDRFLATDPDPDDSGRLAPEALKRYVATTSRLADSTRQTRIASLREFSRWLHARVPGSAILPRDILPRRPRPERFFPIAPAEIEALMAAAPTVLSADPMRAHNAGTLVGLLYCSGLRIAEALDVAPHDLAPDGSTLHVLKGKFGKERLVPLSPSAHAALTAYLAVRRPYALGPDSAPLFVDARGRPLKRDQVYRDFGRLCRHCGVWGDPPPRLHDLRHNYACRRLALWRQAGKDVNAMLPILATAMGHVNILATQRYLHLDAVGLQNAAARFNAYVANHAEPKP